MHVIVRLVPPTTLAHFATDGTLLDSTLELSSSLLAQHGTSQSTIFALELKASELETLVKTTQLQPRPAPVVEVTPHTSETLTQMFTEWKKSVKGQWSSVLAEWAAERERLASAREE